MTPKIKMEDQTKDAEAAAKDGEAVGGIVVNAVAAETESPEGEEGAADATAETPASNGEFPTMFSDEKGNLKVVNLVVHRPCTIFFSIIAVCILINFWLISEINRNGQPFTEEQVSFDINDIRSVQYDSFRLARDEVSQLAVEAGKD